MPIENEASVQEKPAQSEELVEPKAPAWEIEQVAVEFINSSNTESNHGGDMVTQKTMTIDRFVPSARQTAQQQPPQGRGQTVTPPLPPTS